MSKQEEVREGIAKYFERIDYGWSSLDYADNVLDYLASQGLVLKVDRELPGCGCEMCDSDNGVVRLLVEPLIGE